MERIEESSSYLDGNNHHGYNDKSSLPQIKCPTLTFGGACGSAKDIQNNNEDGTVVYSSNPFTSCGSAGYMSKPWKCRECKVQFSTEKDNQNQLTRRSWKMLDRKFSRDIGATPNTLHEQEPIMNSCHTVEERDMWWNDTHSEAVYMLPCYYSDGVRNEIPPYQPCSSINEVTPLEQLSSWFLPKRLNG